MSGWCHERRRSSFECFLFLHCLEATKTTTTTKMSKPFDYSKWDNIELSDDEDDVHPNIDRESWFRMKHRSRVEREDREEADKKKIHEEVGV